MTCHGRSVLLNLFLMIRQNYRTLCSQEIEETLAHMASSDYPEEEQWMLATARKCGLLPDRALLRDEFYGSWAFVAAPVGSG